MKATIEISKINFFGEETGSNEWNAKAMYTLDGKLHHCLVFVDYFNKHVFIAHKNIQFSECKVLRSALLEKKLNEYVFKTK